MRLTIFLPFLLLMRDCGALLITVRVQNSLQQTRFVRILSEKPLSPVSSFRNGNAVPRYPPLFSKSPLHRDNNNLTLQKKSIMQRIWFQLTTFVASMVLVMSLLSFMGAPANAVADLKRYDVSFWTPEMDTHVATRVVPSTTLSIDSPILSNVLSRWEPFMDEDATLSPLIQQQQQPPQPQPQHQHKAVPRMARRTLASANLKSFVVATLVVTAVILGQRDVAFRLRQRAFRKSTLGPTLVRKNPPVNGIISFHRLWGHCNQGIRSHLLLAHQWSRQRRQRSATPTMSLLEKLLKRSATNGTTTKPQIDDMDDDKTVNEGGEAFEYMIPDVSGLRSMAIDEESVEVTQRPDSVDYYETVDALLMDKEHPSMMMNNNDKNNHHQPQEPLDNVQYQRNRENAKGRMIKTSIMLHRNTTDSINYINYNHYNIYDRYDRLKVQAALDRAKAPDNNNNNNKEEQENGPLGIRRTGHGERSRNALTRAVRRTLLRNEDTSNKGVIGLQRSFRDKEKPQEP
jgi:hypothetical protein